MKAVVRRYHSPDVDDFDTYVPPDPEHFSVFVQVMVGPADGPGEESFDLVVCSPDEPAEAYQLVVDRWDWPAVRGDIEARVAAAEGATWDDVARQLGRLGRWEFEGYQP